MTDWVRLWHDMPTDPKWRVIARKADQPIPTVIAIFTFVMVNASANANERGRTHNLNAEDIAAALDIEETDVQAVLDAMQGKVMDRDQLMGWEKRQPKREDSSAERAAAWRERKRTQENAGKRSDADAETDSKNSVAIATDVPSDPTKLFFETGIALLLELNPSMSEKAIRPVLGKLRQKFPEIADAQDALDAMACVRPADPVAWLMACSRSSLPPIRVLDPDELVDPEFYGVAMEHDCGDIEAEWAVFRDHHAGRGTTFRSMVGLSRTWFRRGAEFKRKIYAVK